MKKIVLLLLLILAVGVVVVNGRMASQCSVFFSICTEGGCYDAKKAEECLMKGCDGGDPKNTDSHVTCRERWWFDK